MKESTLHHIWQRKQFDPRGLLTTAGETITLLKQGELNQHSGPDFSGAQLKIGEQIWAGNVEIHIRSSDWNRHGHTGDPAYENVILHVVYIHDEEVKIRSGRTLPTLELRGRLFADSDRPGNSALESSGQDDREISDASSWNINSSIVQSRSGSLPCGSITEDLRMRSVSMQTRSLAERLERKTEIIRMQLLQCANDWEEIFYRQLMQQAGMKINADPFSWLSQITPWKLLSRFRHDIFKLEALLFGQAGMLEANTQLTIGDDKKYFLALQQEYGHLSRLHALLPMNVQAWKYMRLRPNNFPTIRIAQVAHLFSKNEKLFRTCLEVSDETELRRIFDSKASEYWNEHYRFDVKSRNYEKRFGAQATDAMLINAVAPMKFLYGKLNRDEKYCAEAVDLLERIPGEQNSIVLKYEKAGWNISSSADTQGILELKRNYCDRKKCLECEVGRTVLDKPVIALRLIGGR